MTEHSDEIDRILEDLQIKASKLVQVHDGKPIFSYSNLSMDRFKALSSIEGIIESSSPKVMMTEDTKQLLSKCIKRLEKVAETTSITETYEINRVIGVIEALVEVGE